MLPFYSKSKGHILCFVHTLACHVVVNGDEFAKNEYENIPLFPCMAGIKNKSVGGKVTSMIQRHLGKVPGLQSDMTSHSPREGATNDMMLHPQIKLVKTVCHGGWEHKCKYCLFFICIYTYNMLMLCLFAACCSEVKCCQLL